ncbi:MAG: DUF3810 family protein, partial [Prolixibacteraceae bacterium]|nr:DUF3810 family protein [Prolixibacteraceae bacterium]
PMGKRRAKKITFSRFFASASISGYYGPFFNEVHVNKFLLPAEYPVILAHEKAHQFGITSEAEANFYAWLICSQSNSEELKYSAELYILRYFFSQGRNLENYRDFVGLLDLWVKDDLIKIENHWMELRNEKVDKAAGKINNAYLKSNNVEKGIQDYTGVVKFIIDFKNDSLVFQEVQHLKNKK